MIKKKLLLIFTLLCLIFTAGCSDKNSGDETTQPLDKLINGLLNEDTQVYKSAFTPDYITLLEKSFNIIGNDIDTVLKDTFKQALDVHEANYGENIRINYTLISKEEMSKEDLSEKNWNLYVDEYDLPADKISEAYLEEIDITVKGKDSTETKRAKFKLIKIDGVWYLHPENFMYVFSI